jgi:glucokinase
VKSDPEARVAASTGRIVGVDLGGTKCAVSTWDGRAVQEVARMPTRSSAQTFEELALAIGKLVGNEPVNFGVSCGGPLNTAEGVILNPPNLPADWYGMPICRRLTERFGGQAFLMNDANACALAEWKFGAGRDCRHMIFLTSGTGMGAGLILNGQLYEGATGDAGEIGHVRLSPDGPMGYGKAGSVEGFYSGGGIVRLANRHLAKVTGELPAWSSPPGGLTTKQITEAARTGDEAAIAIMREAGTRLGEALAILIDLFNPERIVIGGFYPLCRDSLDGPLHAALARDALPQPRTACAIVPSALGETIGSHGAIAAVLHFVP